jgi:hypothetical protein
MDFGAISPRCKFAVKTALSWRRMIYKIFFAHTSFELNKYPVLNLNIPSSVYPQKLRNRLKQ